MPQPKVGSDVIQLKKYAQPPIYVKNEKFFFKIIRASFNQRRKTLVNGLQNASFLQLKKEDICKALEEMQLSLTIRGEALNIEQFAQLSNLLLES